MHDCRSGPRGGPRDGFSAVIDAGGITGLGSIRYINPERMPILMQFENLMRNPARNLPTPPICIEGWRLVGAVAGVVLCGAARAGAPLVSETADALEAGLCELEAAEGRSRQRDLPSLRASDVQLGCGVGANTQLAMGYTQFRLGGERAQALRAVGKTTLQAPQDGRAGWALGYGLAWDKSAGTRWRNEGWNLRALYTRELLPSVLLHVNLGHSHSRSERQGSTTWSVGIELPQTMTLAADVFGDDRGRPSVSAGAGYRLSKDFSVNAIMAWQFEQPRVRVLTVGAKLEF